MSSTRSLGAAVSKATGYDLASATLGVSDARTSSRRARYALAALVLSGCLVAVAASNTTALLPETIRLAIPADLAGPFHGLGINLHGGGAIAVLTVVFFAYATVVQLAGELSTRSVLMAIAALNAFILLAPPLVSTDIFSYQNYAHMGALYGINPYTHGPYAISFDPQFQYVGSKWSSIPTAYGPVFTVFSYLLASLSVAASVFAYKSVAAVACIGLVAVVWHCARLRGTDPVRAAALVGLNPLLVIYAVGGGHNDLLMLLAMTGGIYAVLRSREREGAGLSVLAAGLKLTGGLVLPFALVAGGRHQGRSRRNLLVGTALAIVLMVAFSLIVFGTGSFHMLNTLHQSQSEGGWQSLPGAVGALAGGTAGHIVGYVAASVFVAVTARLLWRVWRGELDWIDGAAWAMAAMLLASSSLLPWYVAWLLPLAALAHDRRLVRTMLVLTGLVQLIQMLGYIPHGSGLI